MSKVWFITGSSRGLGRQFVEAALARGDQVAATARNPAQLDDLVATYGAAVLPLALDVTDAAAVSASVQRAVDHFGHLDIIVNNAGYGLFGAVEEVTEQQLRDQLDTNVFGPLRVVQAVLPHLREHGGGHIIQVSSLAGLAVFPLGGGYAASKLALEGLSEALAKEVAGFGIKVTLVEPSMYATEAATDDSVKAGVHADPNPLYDGMRDAFATFTPIDLGDPAAAGQAILELADADNPPLRVIFGLQGQQIVSQIYADRLKTWADWHDLSARAHRLTTDASPTAPSA